MAWNIEERFPSWGETGEFPAAGFFYEGGDQVNEKHLDALWNGVNGLEEDVQAAFDDIDADADGIVDETDTVTAGGNLKGDLLAVGGEVVWDESEGHIPQPRLENDSITLNAGDGLDGGGGVALGGSFAASVDVTDLLATGITEDGSNNLELDESVIKDGGAKEIDVQEFSGGDGTNGEVLYTDGANAFWDAPPALTTTDDGVTVLSTTESMDFATGIAASNDGDGSITVFSDGEVEAAYNFVLN